MSGSSDRFVVDASVIVKWFLPEPNHERARALLELLQDPIVDAYAPELAIAEVANVLWTRTRSARAVLTVDEALTAARSLEALPLVWQRHRPLIDRAMSLAIDLGITVYDALYAALAIQVDGLLVTADAKLAARLASPGWTGRCVVLADSRI